MCLFFSDKSIVLFECWTVGEKRSKQIKGPHHYQGHASSTKKSLSHLPSQTISDVGISAVQPQTLPGGQLPTPIPTEQLSQPI
jgi:hypothetical protein